MGDRNKRNGRTTAKVSLEVEIAHLRDLDLKSLRPRWQSVSRRAAPDHLPRHLLFGILAYQIRADRLGDLDHETRKILDRTTVRDSRIELSARLARFDQKRTELTPGDSIGAGMGSEVATGDGGGGWVWNGKTYKSLTKVALAINGTRWNGPRFFGLRDKEDQSATEARS